jgi:hypothetical protein
LTRKPTHIAASRRQRLLQRAQSRGEDFQLTLQRYAVERLLCRLEQSPYHGRFILKGAMLYLVWGEEAYRPTRDLDLLGFLPPNLEALVECFRTLSSMKPTDDGVLFLPESVKAEEIRAAGEYGGIRVQIEARLDSARIDVQVDVGFGDVIVPGPQEVDFPVLLDGPSPRIRVYSRESVVAEKLHAAALLGDANSRMKDFYDLYALSRLFAFDGLTLTRAIAETFERRRMSLPELLPLPAAFFAEGARASRWRAFLAKNGLNSAPQDFTEMGEALREFLAQPYGMLVDGIEFPASWPPGGQWSR